MDMPCKLQDRSANELPAETQTLRGHNSAPHATRTLRACGLNCTGHRNEENTYA